ncbi:YrrS family protein [Lentibacillus daqui]|uniref:YrrS family protein n=1 Tax=Lentibacillus daqui TaxID=2911514 RepID=UPI0022B12080|nr:DUF1510 family protein [Lentibacillus daqui]
MDDDNNKNSRVDRFEKRRKNTKWLSIMLVVGAVLVVLLIGTFIFGGNDEADKTSDEKQTSAEHASGTSDPDTTNKDSMDLSEGESSENDEQQADEQEHADNDQDEDTDKEKDEDTDKEKDETDTDKEEVKTKKVETSDDNNVAEAYKGNWKPVGTEQKGSHTTNYDEGTQDRKEMEEAAAVGAGLDPENMTAWWLGRAGDQKVTATVSGKNDPKTYRVHLTWVDDQGWKPTKVEVLKENDKK